MQKPIHRKLYILPCHVQLALLYIISLYQAHMQGSIKLLYIEIEIGKGYQETEYQNLFKSSNAGKGTEVPSGLPHREIWDHLSNP